MTASNAKSKKPKEEEKRTQKLNEKQKTPTKKKVDAKKSNGSNSTAKATKTAKTPEKKTTANGKAPSKQTQRRDNEPKKRKAVANGKLSETDDAEGLLSSSESEEVVNGGKVKNKKGQNPKTKKRKRKEEEEEEDESGDHGEEKGEEKMCRFPMKRIKRIIKIENFDVGITQEAIFLVNKATEKFLEKVADDGYKCCIKDKNKSLSYNHLCEFSCEIESNGRVHIQGSTSGGKTIKKRSRVFRMKHQQQLCPPGPFTISFSLPGPVDPRLFSPELRSDGIFEGVVRND